MELVTQPEFALGTINVGWIFIAIGLSGILAMIIGAILLTIWEADIQMICSEAEPEEDETF